MKKLKNGWVQGSTQEFLELSDADMAYIETKRALAACLRDQRMKRHLTQTELAARLETSQSSVAKMESGNSTVSIGRWHSNGSDCVQTERVLYWEDRSRL